MVAQSTDIVRRAMARRLRDDLGLDEPPGGIGRRRLLKGRAGDEGAAIGPQHDETREIQPLQRLTHEGAADPEDAAQLLLSEPGPGWQPALADGLLHGIRDRIARQSRPKAKAPRTRQR